MRKKVLVSTFVSVLLLVASFPIVVDISAICNHTHVEEEK
jgi:hypothetical protein